MTYALIVHYDTRSRRLFEGNLIFGRTGRRSAVLVEAAPRGRRIYGPTFLAQTQGGRHDELADTLRHSGPGFWRKKNRSRNSLISHAVSALLAGRRPDLGLEMSQLPVAADVRDQRSSYSHSTGPVIRMRLASVQVI